MTDDPTDPRELPGADPHTGNRIVDPVTGYETTGHDWGGITELNTAFPKIVIWALIVTCTYAVIAWFLLPAWPLGSGYTRGFLGLDQKRQAIEGYRELADGRENWLSRFEAGDFAALQADSGLMATAMPAAERLFDDNCAACHGEAGQGGPGYPVLSDGYWLWGGGPAAIAETVRFGINANHPDTRVAEMPPFAWMDYAERTALAEYVADLPQGGGHADTEAATLFADNCASCHGDGGVGGLEGIGAPSLADASAIYGQDEHTVMETLKGGRHGVMPAWEGRLSGAEINLLALYVAALKGADSEAGE